MRYQLGIDLGTTYTAAAVHRDGRAQVVGLGSHAAAVPSVLFLQPGQAVLAGEAADRRAATDFDRVIKEFKRRLGDPTPLLVGGEPYTAQALSAKLLRWVVDAVASREGGPPERTVVSHPANWGPYKQDLLRQAVRMAGLPTGVAVRLLTEPEAAAISYASAERVEPGRIVAVYDLGGGTFDAAVLRKTAAGGAEAGRPRSGAGQAWSFEVLGEPEGIERLGGVDFDEAIVAHVDRVLGGALGRLDPDDPQALAAAARLRRECVEAKEALSSDTDVVIPVLLPDAQTQVRLIRAEFEAMIRPALDETIAALRRALRSAGVTPEQISAVLLVGGSSRIPLVAQLVSAELGRPVAVDAHPKHAIALGAALAAAPEDAAPARPARQRRAAGGHTWKAVDPVAPESQRPPEPAPRRRDPTATFLPAVTGGADRPPHAPPSKRASEHGSGGPEAGERQVHRPRRAPRTGSALIAVAVMLAAVYLLLRLLGVVG